MAFAYTKLVLFLPPGKKNFKEKATTIKSRISTFLAGRLDDLWRQATRQTPRRSTPSSSSSPFNVRRATLLAQEGQFSKAAKALVSKGLDFNSPEVLRNMAMLNPPSPPPPPLPTPAAAPYTFTSAEVLSRDPVLLLVAKEVAMVSVRLPAFRAGFHAFVLAAG